MRNEKNIVFSGADRSSWIQTVCVEQACSDDYTNTDVIVCINNLNSIEELEPMHIVLLASLRQYLKDKGCDICYLRTDNDMIKDFLFNDVNLGKYWKGDEPANYTTSNKETVFNLWHVTESELEFYSRDVFRYLQKSFFKNKDLSSVQESLIEGFRNIFDHADAKGNSFSYIKFDKDKSKLYIAVCDFGKGIARSIRDYFHDVHDDASALLKAIEYEVTTKSKQHNRGFGLGTIIAQLSDSDTLRIASNRALLVVTSTSEKAYVGDLNFSGTLIYYEVSLDKFEDLEIIDNFALNDIL